MAASGSHRSNRSPRKRNPVSRRSRAQISDIENSSSRDWRRNSRPSVRDVRYSSPETGPFTANPRECRHSSEHRKRQARDHCGWLGISDSNLEMSESKSSWFAWVISAHFEKVRRFGPFLKRLAVISECRAMVTAYQRHTRPSPTSACGPALSLVWRDLRPPCIWDGLGERRYGEVG